MTRSLLPLALCLLLVTLALCAPGPSPLHAGVATADEEEGFVPLLDGETLDGWVGDPALWKVADGAIVGQTDGTLEHNTFLSTTKQWGDFVLKVSARLAGGNSGVQFRSRQHEDYIVSGYQADIAPRFWGLLYEERGRGILAMPKPEAVAAAKVKSDGWNQYRITARGDHIVLQLNGVTTVDLVDRAGAKRGIIALQLHVGEPMKVWFKDIAIKELK